MPAKSRPKRTSRTNVIWVIADQMRAQALGAMGDPNARTPVLEEFSSSCVTFTNAVAGAPSSVPFRRALLTGRYPRAGLSGGYAAIEPGQPLLTDIFNKAGYLTAWFGKWRIGGAAEDGYVPRAERGRFRVWLGYDRGVSPNECWIHGHDLGGRDDERAEAERIGSYEADGMTSRFVGFLEEFGKSKPFFAVLSLQAPHHPHIAPAEFSARYRPESIRLRPNVPDLESVVARARGDLAGYYAQIENLDWNFGRLLESLKRLGLEGNTHVFFFSDHGDMHGSHGAFRMGSPWEESLRIPFLVRPSAGVRRVGHFASAALNHVDIPATTLGLCHLEAPDWLEGTDLSCQVAAGRPAPESLPAAACLQHIAPGPHDGFDRPWRGLRTVDGWKYICLEGQPLALFNLNEDPYEMANLAFSRDHATRRSRLQAELARRLAAIGDPFTLPLD